MIVDGNRREFSFTSCQVAGVTSLGGGGGPGLRQGVLGQWDREVQQGEALYSRGLAT